MRRPLLTPTQRATFLSLCTAAYGLAIAIASFPLWIRESTPDQLPGFHLLNQVWRQGVHVNLESHRQRRFGTNTRTGAT